MGGDRREQVDAGDRVGVRSGRSVRVHSAARLVGVALIALATVGCTRSESVTSVTPAPSTEPPPTTTTTSTTTTVPATTVESTTTTTTSTTSTTTSTSTTVPPIVIPDAPATFVALDGRSLVERDSISGAVTRTIVNGFVGEAVFPGQFALTNDRRRLYYSEFVEDGWYSCATSAGFINVVDVASGRVTFLDSGSSPAVSPDGRLLAYLATETCIPDPQAPADWVLTPYDRVVVTDVVTGERFVHGVPAAPRREGDPNALTWVGFEDGESLIVTTGTGAVHRIPARQPTIPQSTPLLFVLDDLLPVDIFGGRLFALRGGAEGSSDLYGVDTATGTATALVRSERFLFVAVSPEGRVIVSNGDPGAPRPEVLVPEPIVVSRIDQTIGDIEW